MKYMGSKARHAKDLLPIILAGRKVAQCYVEPFVGGANVIDKVPGRRIANDLSQPLITLLRAMADGWTPPPIVTEEDYAAAKALPDGPLKSYIGFCLSYGGKWFGGYRRDKAGARCYSTEALKNYLKQQPAMRGVEFNCGSYKQLDIPASSIIYCDPPYAGATKYASGTFDHSEFWEWCDLQHDGGHSIFVSEYQAPAHWPCVWQKPVNNTLTKNTGSKQGVEKLFTRIANPMLATL